MALIKRKYNEIISLLHKRILWADIAKALAIICIIWGHAASGNAASTYRNILYSFHIPAFLVVSGFLMKFPDPNNQTVKGYLFFLLKNILCLVVPYVFWGIFFSDFTVESILPILYGSYQTIKTVNVVGALWFVPCFFLARTFVYTLMVLFNKIKIKKILLGISGIIFLVIGFVLPLLENGYFFSVNISFVLAGFVILGIVLKDLLELLSNSKWFIILIVFVVSSIVFYFGTAFRGEDFELVCIYNGKYGNIFWFLFNSLFGTSSLISLSMLIAKFDCKFVRGLQYIGTQTLGLLFIHVPFIRQVMIPWFTEIGFTSPYWFVALIAGLCTLVVCFIAVVIMDFLCPILVGKFKFDESKEV